MTGKRSRRSNSWRLAADETACESMPSECCICLLDLTHELGALRCGHVFHITCIRALRNASRTEAKCPLCRKQINGILPLFWHTPGASQAAVSNSGVDGVNNAIEVSDGDVSDGFEIIAVDRTNNTNHNGEVSAQEREVALLREEVEILRGDLADADAELEERASEFEHLARTLQGLQQSNQALRAENNELEASLRAERMQFAKQRDVIAAEAAAWKRHYQEEMLKAEEKLRNANHLVERMTAELSTLRTVRLGADIELAIRGLATSQLAEQLELWKSQSAEELLAQVGILTNLCRDQQQSILRREEEVRQAKVEAEYAARKIKSLQDRLNQEQTKAPPSKPNNPIPMSISTIPIPGSAPMGTKRPIDIPSYEMPLNAPQPKTPRPNLAIIPPPKFKTTKQFSTIADGCGGQKKTFNFP